MSPPSWLGLPFWLVALVFSVFYGWKARDIFQVKRDHESWAYLTHQFWFNFAGSLCGWAAFWLEAVNVYWYAATGAKIEFSFSDAALAVLAFIGMTGLLPMTIVGLIQGIRDLAAKLAGVGK